MPGIEIDCFPWDCPRARRLKRAQSRGLALNRSAAKSKSDSPAIVIGSFKPLNNDKLRITISKQRYFDLPITAEVRHTLRGPGDETEVNRGSCYGMALVKWKTGPDAKVTWISTFPDHKNLAKYLAKHQALAVYNKWVR